MGISAARRWLSRCLPSSCAALGARRSLSSIPQRPQLRRSATRRIMARSPSCAKSGFPSLRTVPARRVEQSMATGTTLSIWMLRTRVACVASLGDDPDGKITRLLDWTGRPGDVADPLVHRQFRCHLPRRARRLRRYARAAVGKRGRRPRLRRETSVDNLPQ